MFPEELAPTPEWSTSTCIFSRTISPKNCLKINLMNWECDVNIRSTSWDPIMLPVTDPRGRPPRTKLSQFQAVFGKLYVGAPDGGLAPPPREITDPPQVTGTRSHQERLSKLELGFCCQRVMKLVNVILVEHMIRFLSSVDRYVI